MKNRANGEAQNVGFYYYYRNFIDQCNPTLHGKNGFADLKF